MRFFSLLVVVLLAVPCTLKAQSQAQTNRWVIAGSLGAGVADVPTSLTPVYFDATQLTARFAVQRALGAGLFGGVSALATVATEGGDCTLGPCAPQFQHSAGHVTLSYVPGSAVQQWIPIASAAAGIARLREPWAAAPGRRAPAPNALLLSGALDLPLLVRSRSALLVGWEGSVLPNAPGGQITINTIVLTMRHAFHERLAH